MNGGHGTFDFRLNERSKRASIGLLETISYKYFTNLEILNCDKGETLETAQLDHKRGLVHVINKLFFEP